jgi:hypothetical protein
MLHAMASLINPIECALASCDLVATRLRTRPSASSRRYSSDILSAPMKSLQVTLSHWPSRRSSLLVAYTRILLAKYAASWAGSRSASVSAAVTVSTKLSGVYGTGMGEGGNGRGIVRSGRPPERENRDAVARTRLSHVPR